MLRASFALVTTLLLSVTPALAEPVQLFAQGPIRVAAQQSGDAKGSANQAPNANAEAFNSKVDALFTQGQGLTAEDAAAHAVRTNYTVRQQKATMHSQEELKTAAKMNFIPPITFNASYLRVRHIMSTFNEPQGPVLPGGIGTIDPPIDQAVAAGAPYHTPGGALVINYLKHQAIVGAQITVPLSAYFFSLPQQLAAANRALDAATYNERNQELTAATDAKVAYYEWVRAKLQQIVQEQALSQARAQANDVRAQFEAGAATRADVLRLESNVATTELNVESARNAANLAEETLRTQMHDADKSTPYRVGEDVREDVPELTNIDDMSQLWIEAESKRLDLKALDAQAKSSHERAEAQRAGNYPTINGIGTYTENNPLQQKIPQSNSWAPYWTLGGQLTWTPTAIFANQGQVHSYEAQAAAYEAQRNQARDNLHVNVLNALQSLRLAEIGLETTRHALEASEESYRVRRALFQNGRATTVEVIDAETDLTRARESAVNSRIDLRVARTRLINSVGRDTDRMQ